ncbi:alanine racemase [Alteromonas halophila]|uniref:Alanine racemase n=1 Tax=Alteromonas halophila TaxID=516698 RepID=A0A918JR68_9ALTE|nr:alanine racemase [Alteromonas halophila]GGW94673.1 alanine racemase [Alteromonas halophila]
MTQITELVTPVCVIDRYRFINNVERVKKHIASTGATFRPHVKTLKSVEAAAYYAPPGTPITVSTLAEAAHFAGAGYTDILYAVTLTPNKLPAVYPLHENGVMLTVMIDSQAALDSLASSLEPLEKPLPVAIEVDVDGARAGLTPDDPELILLAKAINASAGLYFRGLVTHGGASYGCFDDASRQAMAQQENDALLAAKDTLANEGVLCDLVSLGSTPTALADISRDGISDIRAGVFTTFDCVMANIGICEPNDIALKVATRVIKVDTQKKRVLIDAGWMALSRDTGTQGQWRDCGYGLVCDIDGNLLDGWTVSATSQEHGTITHASGDVDPSRLFAFGDTLQILPVHACATAAQFSHYEVCEDNVVCERWHRINGW